jgi:uncharacterized protein (TIRG00374 family)
VTEPTFQPPDTQRALKAGLLSGVFGLVIIVLVTVAVGRSHINADTLSGIVSRTQLLPMMLSLVLMSVAFLFLGLRWQALFPPPHRPPGAGLAAILCAGLLLNSALPGPVGEFGAAWFAHKRYRAPLGMTLAAGLGARIIGMIMAASAALLCWMWADLPIPEGYQTTIQATTILVAMLGSGLAAAVIMPDVIARIAHMTLGRFPKLDKLNSLITEVTDALLDLQDSGPGAFLRCFGWSAIAHSSVLFGILMAAWSLGADPSVPGLLFTYATTTAAVIVMFALPGSQVGWDAIFLTLLTTTAGLTMSDALAVAIVVRIQQLCIMGAGAVALSWLARSDTQADE